MKDNRVVFIGYPQILESADLQDSQFFNWLTDNGCGNFSKDLALYLHQYKFDVALHTITVKQLGRHQLVHTYFYQQKS
jgi:hypothetical protein